MRDHLDNKLPTSRLWPAQKQGGPEQTPLWDLPQCVCVCVCVCVECVVHVCGACAYVYGCVGVCVACECESVCVCVCVIWRQGHRCQWGAVHTVGSTPVAWGQPACGPVPTHSCKWSLHLRARSATGKAQMSLLWTSMAREVHEEISQAAQPTLWTRN